MAIRFFNDEISFTLKNKRILASWIKDTIFCYQYKVGNINFIFTNNTRILEINKKYLSHNYFTDIITFNFNTDKTISGDIYISVDTVKENSVIFSVPFLNELNRVMIHGILHLLGYDDFTDEEKTRIRELENAALLKLDSQYLIK